MNLNMLVFPAPKLLWNWKSYIGELIWIPAKKDDIKDSEFYTLIKRRSIKGKYKGNIRNYTKEKMQNNWEKFQQWNDLENQTGPASEFEASTKFSENLDEFDESITSVADNLKKYPPKIKKSSMKFTEHGDISSVSTNNASRTRSKIQIRNKNMTKNSAHGECFDDFVELYISNYVPCILIPPHYPSSKIVVYFHANAEDIGQSYPLCSEINDDLDCYVLIVEYCGYSVYEGSPSQERLFKDSEAVWNYLTKVMNFDSRDIFIIGRSIGTGSALHLSTIQRPGSLCLISPFTSIKDVVKHNYGGLAAGMLKERFNNKEKIKNVKCPVLFIHGKEDELVPYKCSKQLYGEFLNFLFFLELCQTPAEILIFNEMTHQTFDVSDCISIPLQRFVEKVGLRWKTEKEPNIFIPFFAFSCPISQRKFMKSQIKKD